MDGSHDPFIEKFFSRIPRDLAATFTPDQLHGVKLAFGARSWGAHAIDVRKSFRLFRNRFYVVLLIGAERRDLERLRAEGEMFGTLGNALIAIAVLGCLLVPMMLALYALKSVAGVDLVPGDGFHGFWENLSRQLDLVLR